MNEEQKREFFNKIAIESGTTGTESVRRIYFGLVRAIGKELRASGKLQLPDLGTVRVHVQKPKRLMVNEKMMNIPATKTVKFSPDHKLKEFVKLL